MGGLSTWSTGCGSGLHTLFLAAAVGNDFLGGLLSGERGADTLRLEEPPFEGFTGFSTLSILRGL